MPGRSIEFNDPSHACKARTFSGPGYGAVWVVSMSFPLWRHMASAGFQGDNSSCGSFCAADGAQWLQLRMLHDCRVRCWLAVTDSASNLVACLKLLWACRLIRDCVCPACCSLEEAMWHARPPSCFVEHRSSFEAYVFKCRTCGLKLRFRHTCRRFGASS